MTLSDSGPKGPLGEPGLTLQSFLEFMNNDLQNEWTHLKFYLYHSALIAGLHSAEYREFFTDAAKGEMEHVQAFMDRLLGLNYSNPTQTSAAFSTFSHPADAITHAIELEMHVVENYIQRLKQLEHLSAAHPVTARYLTVFYEDQLKDSYEDCERMRRIMSDDLRQILRNTRHDPHKFLAK
jgi:bacterioferritin (cytochrome b1)